MAMPRQNLQYLSLPPEVPNHIMSYVLMPGDVPPRVALIITPPPRRNRTFVASFILKAGTVVLIGWGLKSIYKTPSAMMGTSLKAIYKAPLPIIFVVLSGLSAPFFKDLCPFLKIKPRRASQPGFQLLASCKQVYHKGRYMFYGTNTFHLPRGSLEDTMIWYDKLILEDKTNMRSVQLTLGVADLTPMVLEKFELWRSSKAHDSCHAPMYHCAITYLLEHVWTQKLEFLRAWDGLDTVCISTEIVTFKFRGAVFAHFKECDLTDMLNDAVRFVRAELRRLISGLDWDAAKALLMEKARVVCV